MAANDFSDLTSREEVLLEDDRDRSEVLHRELPVEESSGEVDEPEPEGIPELLKPTVIFEARLRAVVEDELNTRELISVHCKLSNLLQELEVRDITCNIDDDILPLLAERSGNWKLWAVQELESLVPVDIMAVEHCENPKVIELGQVKSRFCVYKMHGTPPQPPRVPHTRSFTGSDSTNSDGVYEDPVIPSAEVFDMPHHEFDGNWEELVFDRNHKEDLSWMISNMLNFSAGGNFSKKRMSPMALFHGPPGTGKTTLCQAIAQRLAIRLVETFPHTKLIQVKTATLLSKYYSESATQVDDLLTKVKQMCQNDPARIIIVLIDEVESIAVSRHSGVLHGEAQDSLRATNALLTGFDRVRSCPNVVFMSTSNMVDCLDEAFIDRCAIQIPFQPPSKESQYKILKASVLELVRRGIIEEDISTLINYTQLIGSWQEAEFNSEHYSYVGYSSTPTGKLYNIIFCLNSPSAKGKLGVSGRFLTQIPEQALMKCARPNKELSLAKALDCIESFILDLLQQRGEKRRLSELTGQSDAKHCCCCAAGKDE